jgi:adenylate cyclase
MKRISLSTVTAIVVMTTLVLLRQMDPQPLQELRLKSFDMYQRLSPREEIDQPVTIVDLDEESLRAYGQWPWPRNLVARLVKRLLDDGAVVIGFDIVFAEPDRMSPSRIAGTIPGLDRETRAMLEAVDNDVLLAGQIRGLPIVLGQAGANRALAEDEGRSLPRKVQFAYRGGDPHDWLSRYPGFTRNIPVLEDAAAGIGMFSLDPEIDGVVRRVPMILRVGDEIYPSLILEMLRVATAQSTIVVSSGPGGIEAIIVGSTPIPTDSEGRTWVNFAPHSRARFVSAKDVLDGVVPPERIAGRLILIGTSAVGLLDIKATPVHDAMAGVEVHAQLLETILSNTYLSRPGYFWVIEIFLIILVCGIIMAMVGRVPAAWSMITASASVITMFGVSWTLYADQGLLLAVTFPAISAFIFASVLTYLRYVHEESERRQVRDAFSRYMSPALVEQLADHPDRLKLGGEMRDMTLLFCDIRGFTGISEDYKSDPEGLTRLINKFLTPMTDVILEGRGTIDKYMGDAIMAFWNAPLDDEEHARHACGSALGMVHRLKRVNEELRADAEATGHKFRPIRIGIGINSGECCVGNMGSEQRFDYSVLGDDVNLASRLEGQCKTYGVDVIVGENTREDAADYAAIELDLIRVKGRGEAVRIYALLGDADLRGQPWFADLEKLHGEMLAAYRDQSWRDVRRLVGECRELNGGLGPLYDLYERRVDAHEAEPPGADWNGVFAATEK